MAGDWFFGYYDKPPWSSDMTKAVFHRLDRENAAIMVLDRTSKEQSLVGVSNAWNWQQGSMAQWMPGKGGYRIIFNLAEHDVLGCRLIELNGMNSRFIPWPIQTVHPMKNEALTLNYRRLARLRPDYGYSLKVKNFSPTERLDNDGIWRIDLDGDKADLILSLAELSQFRPVPEMRGSEHKVNHLIYSPSGAAFVFLHRFIGSRGKRSRLYVARTDGSNLALLMDARMVSHYHWRDENHILVWGRTMEKGDHYYLIDIRKGTGQIVGEGTLDKYGDGHCSFSPDRRWIVTDTYPDRSRQQRLMIFDTINRKTELVGRFFSPWKFMDSYRCDLHPRWSPDGKWISIDSAHEGRRRTYFMDVSKIVGGN